MKLKVSDYHGGLSSFLAKECLSQPWSSVTPDAPFAGQSSGCEELRAPWA